MTTSWQIRLSRESEPDERCGISDHDYADVRGFRMISGIRVAEDGFSGRLRAGFLRESPQPPRHDPSFRQSAKIAAAIETCLTSCHRQSNVRTFVRKASSYFR